MLLLNYEHIQLLSFKFFRNQPQCPLSTSWIWRQLINHINELNFVATNNVFFMNSTRISLQPVICENLTRNAAGVLSGSRSVQRRGYNFLLGRITRRELENELKFISIDWIFSFSVVLLCNNVTLLTGSNILVWVYQRVWRPSSLNSRSQLERINTSQDSFWLLEITVREFS